VIIGGVSVVNGGVLPTTGPAGELGDFSFAEMDPATVNETSLSGFDTAVLNVAGRSSDFSFGMYCDMNNLSSSARSSLVAFVEDGNKLIIYDSECTSQDYSWLPFPFTTANPGALGAFGTLTIVEENLLSTSAPTTDPHYIDAGYLGTSTDAVGDMNVMTTFDPEWCVDMSGTNAISITGPVQTYAKTGVDEGLIIYNGLDLDYLGWIGNLGDTWLRKIWVQQLQQPFNPSNLPCGITVVGITLGPDSDINFVGEDHTVTASLADLLGNPQIGVEVTFDVTSGPNAGVTGICAANADCTTDANGEVSFTYAGTGGIGIDEIVASFVNEASDVVFSQIVYKEWEPPPALPVPVDIKPTSCRNPFNVDKRGVMPVAILGTDTFDVRTIDPATVRLEGVSPLRWSYRDVATPYEPYLGKQGAFDCTTEGPDGYLDLTLKFSAQEIAAALGGVADGDVLTLSLDGYLLDGTTYIIGEDVVVILMKKKK